jgi:hypothetical protein
VFAGAVREAVFSNPDVIRRVKADFVPVALKAGLLNNPTDDEEGRLYREIGRSKLAPQGICVVNSAGKVLAWTMAFDDDKSVLAFLDHSARRFAQFPDAKKPVAAERYMRFPSVKLAEVADNGKAPFISDRHPEGKHCPATTRVRQGTVLARVFGRALDKDGKPLVDTVRQEHYVEDRFHVPVAMQEALAKALADAGTERFRLADDLARLLVSHAFLGQLDVNPLGDAPGGGKGSLKQCEFWARKVDADGNGPVRVRVEGKSEAAGGTSDAGRGGDRAFWRHEVKLTWEGIIEIKKDRVPRLLLVARGSEKLEWGNKNLPKLKGQADVRVLVGGHAIDLSCGVRYGIIGEPVAADEAGDADEPQRPQEVPAEAGRQLMETLGPGFMVFRDKVQEDLKVSDEQRQKLAKRLQNTVHDAMPFFEKLADKEPEEREKEVHSYRQKVQENLAAFLEGALKDEQLKRLRQLELQQEGPFALVARPDLGKELKITDEQRKQFMAVVQDLQKKIEPLIKEAQSGGNPQEIRPKIMKIRREHEGRIEGILSDAQKKQWKEIRGKPLDLGD